MKDPDDIIMYKESVEKLRIHIFLNGLNAEFEQVRGEILRMDPSLDLKPIYAYVHREANRKNLISDLASSNIVAMLARRNNPSTRQANTSATPSSTTTSCSFDI